MACLVVQCTTQCNARCRYCPVVPEQGDGASMSLQVLEQMLRRIDEYLRERPEERVELLWHGGEPLLAGLPFFEAIERFQGELCTSTADRVDHSIQTNLTCIDEGFLDVFGRLGLRTIGTSYDPIPGVRGLGRSVDSAAYSACFVRAVSLLERYGFDWGLIYVVTRESLERPLDIFFFLTNLTSSGAISFNPVLITEKLDCDLTVTPEQYAEFLGAIFPSWWRHRQRFPDVQPFAGITARLLEAGSDASCMAFGVCEPRSDHLLVSPLGDVEAAGGIGQGSGKPLGNLAANSLGEILAATASAAGNRVTCRDCRLFSLCSDPGDSSPSDARGAPGVRPDRWCVARRSFIENHFEPIVGVRV